MRYGLWPLAVMVLGAWLPWSCGSTESTPPPYEELGGSGGTADGPGPSSSSHASGSGGMASSSHTAASSSHASSSAASSGSGGAMCDDTGAEPNEDEATATDLGMITDCDGTGSMKQGVLAGPDDVDWYKYSATDELGCVVDPQRGLTIAGTARLCKFIDCATGSATLSCPMGTTMETSPGGLPGCCGSDDFQEDLDCDGVDDDATVYIRLDQASDACAKYTLTYHY